MVDRDGVVWPYDGTGENEYLKSVGTRYIYDAQDLAVTKEQYALRMKSQASRRAVGRADIPPAKAKRVGKAKDIAAAVLGRSTDKTTYVPTGAAEAV